MARGIVDYAGMQNPQAEELRAVKPPAGLPFDLTKIGHVVLKVQDLKKSVDFYTQVLGMHVSDVYPDTMMKGGMVFMRFNNDHHGIALVGGAQSNTRNAELHHLAFEVETIDEVLLARDHLRKHNAVIDFDGRRRAGCQVAVEFRDPDGHVLEIYWGLDQVTHDGVARPPEEWREELSLEGAVNNAPVGQDTTLKDPKLLRG